MRCCIRYVQPVTKVPYYLVDLAESDLRPIGCFASNWDRATIFETKRDAKRVAAHVATFGYLVSVVPPPTHHTWAQRFTSGRA